MADAIINALKGVDPADAMPFGAANTPQGSQTMLGSMLSGLFGMPKHLIDAAKTQDTEAMIPAATQTALALAGVGAPAAEAGALGSFGGKGALTADLKALKEAKKMRMNGLHPADVRNDTGWFRPISENKWMFEIPDNNMKLNTMLPEEGGKLIANVGNFVDNPELFKAYPQLRDYKMELSRAKNSSGWFNSPSEELVGIAKPKIEVFAPDSKEARSVAAHELQHGIAHIEGFQQGINPSWYAQSIERGLKNTPEGYKNFDFNKLNDISQDLYHRTAGEVVPRNVQKRLDYSPMERRLNHPWETQDVPYADQILFDKNSLMVNALKDVFKK